jgi:hypothetical protein
MLDFWKVIVQFLVRIIFLDWKFYILEKTGWDCMATFTSAPLGEGDSAPGGRNKTENNPYLSLDISIT